MFKPELYQKSNSAPKIDGLEAIKNYIDIIKWKPSDVIIDLGCGDGATTTDIFKSIHPNYKKLIGTDVSKAMVDFANKNYSDDRTSFKVFDLGLKPPKEMKNSFDHAFSFYVIHWIANQKIAFTNIHSILKEGGDCLLVFPAYTRIHDFYRELAKHNKWKPWMKDMKQYISPYQDSENPEEEVKSIMEDVGFKHIEVKCFTKSYINDIRLFKTTMEAILPFKIPPEMCEEFMNDYLEIVKKMQLTHMNNDQTFVTVDYTLLVIYGIK